MWLEKLLGKLFTLEEINGHGVCATYLYRWTLWHHDDGRSVMIHKFVGDDWSKDLHDHPKHFWTIGLWGMYREHYWPGEPWSSRAVCVRDYHAPWFRHFPPEHRHRLMVEKPCWTLVIVGSTQRVWGFWHSPRWPFGAARMSLRAPVFVPWQAYVMDGELREQVKTCP